MEFFGLFGEGRQYHTVWYRYTMLVNTIELPLPAWYYPMHTSNSSKIYMPADLGLPNFFKTFHFTPRTCAQCPMPNA